MPRLDPEMQGDHLLGPLKIGQKGKLKGEKVGFVASELSLLFFGGGSLLLVRWAENEEMTRGPLRSFPHSPLSSSKFWAVRFPILEAAKQIEEPDGWEPSKAWGLRVPFASRSPCPTLVLVPALSGVSTCPSRSRSKKQARPAEEPGLNPIGRHEVVGGQLGYDELENWRESLMKA